MNVKAEKFSEFLKANSITCFEVQEADDEMKSVVFRSQLELEGQILPMIVITDESIYTVVRVQIIAGMIRENNKQAILDYINELNRQYKVFKYYGAENGDLVFDSWIPCTDDEFNSAFLAAMIDLILKHLIEQYPILMGKIWSN